MRRWRFLGLGLLAVPRLAHAANIQILNDLVPTGMDIISAGYLFGAGFVVWKGIGVLQAYNHRDQAGGMGEVWWAIAVTMIGGLFIGVIIPRIVAPIAALGATL